MPLVCGLFYRESPQFRLRSSPGASAVYPESCQSRRLATALTPEPTGHRSVAVLQFHHEN
ncbi:Hypothetical protein SMAX5B_009886 [Scophthalmus maximus]|uniref:Uncharacterized protein n=1 Tax=Scophthalmus maximus TaxID=52904 RepID=A0A2U9BYB0_SCOMX|nr:Hypothetical protein SMAX5B_009886 [Scophthalmus maximus]